MAKIINNDSVRFNKFFSIINLDFIYIFQNKLKR